MKNREENHITKANDFPKPVKVAFKSKDVHTMDHLVLLRRLDRYNPELKSGNWHILDIRREPQSFRWIFVVDQDSADAIRRVMLGPEKKAADMVVADAVMESSGDKIVPEVSPESPVADTEEQVSEDSLLLGLSQLSLGSDGSDSTLIGTPLQGSDVEGSIESLPSEIRMDTQ